MDYIMSRKPAPLPTATDVRAWGRDHGFEVTDRGRLSHELIAAYNKRRKVQFVQTKAPEPKVLVVVGKKGTSNGRNRKVTESTTHNAIRVWAKEAGFDLGVRGRVPSYIVDAYAVRNAAPAK